MLRQNRYPRSVTQVCRETAPWTMGGWKRNKKVASTSRLRMLPGVPLDMAGVVMFAWNRIIEP